MRSQNADLIKINLSLRKSIYVKMTIERGSDQNFFFLLFFQLTSVDETKESIKAGCVCPPSTPKIIKV